MKNFLRQKLLLVASAVALLGAGSQLHAKSHHKHHKSESHKSHKHHHSSSSSSSSDSSSSSSSSCDEVLCENNI